MAAPHAAPFMLEMFGGLALTGAEGPMAGRVTQRRRLALLAILAVERRPVSRDKLLGLLWPETNADRGRHLLADSLYVLRAGLSEDALHTGGDDISLNEASVSSDVARFLDAIETGDPEHAAVAYRGPFLDGVYVAEAPEFERWADAVRSRLASAYHGCLERLAKEADSRGEHATAVGWWRALAVAEPVSSRAAGGLIRALARSGDRAAALQFARVHEEIVRAELDATPDPAFAALVAEFRAASDAPRASPPERSSTATPVADAIMAATTVSDAHEAYGEAPHRAASTTRWSRPIIVAVAGILVAALAGGAVMRARRHASADAPAAGVSRVSIAVLPFESISSDRAAEYIAEGVTDAVTMALDRLHRMAVVSQTSASAAKRSGLTATAIGVMLQTRYLLEGSVRLVGDQMRIAARLSDAHDGKLLWSEEFTRDYSPRQVIDVEEAIARSIAGALNIRLDSSRASLAGPAPTNAESFDAYLRGRHLWNSRNPDGVRKSIGYFEQAIAKDSTFAPAYAGLADAYATFAIGNIGDFRADEYFPRARAAAARALTLDSTLAEAHASLGYFHLLYDLDWTTAARELSHAVELTPSYPTAHIYRTVLFEWTGRFADAVSEAREALRFDPLSLATNIELGRALFFAGQYDEAEKQLRLALDLDATSLRAHLHLGQVLERRRRFDDAIAELTQASALSTNSSRPLALLAHAYAAAGKRGEAAALLDSLQAKAQHSYVPAFDFAIIYTGLGRTTDAVQWLERALEDHSIRPYLMDPTFDGIRTDARFGVLMSRLHLPRTLPRP